METNLCEQPPPRTGMFVDGGILPGDLLVEILLRLPMRHLLRLRFVCKSWCALIDDINFVKRHYQVHYSICKEDGDIPFLSWGPQTDGLNWDLLVCLFSKRNGDVPLNLMADLARDSSASFASAPNLFSQGHIVGTVNGIVCFIWGYHNFGLWNPATREFKAITPWLNHEVEFSCLCLVGFGFDCNSNEFKIVRVNTSDDGTHSPEVYSLTSNTWKRLRESSPFDRGYSWFCMHTYLNGVCYWAVFSDASATPLIVSFNFSTDIFEVSNSPQNAIDPKMGYEYSRDITLYKECLAFVVKCTDLEKAVCNFDVWVVTEFHDDSGIPVSWQRLFTIGPIPSSDNLGIVTFRMGGDILFITMQGSSLYDPSTGTFSHLGYNLGDYSGYIESLFPLPKRLNQR